MKAKNKEEEYVRFTARVPKNIYSQMEDYAITNRRSINDEMIIAIQEYYSSGLIKWNSIEKRFVENQAKNRNCTFSEAVNYLINERMKDSDITESGIEKAIEDELKAESAAKKAV